jgi:integrase
MSPQTAAAQHKVLKRVLLALRWLAVDLPNRRLYLRDTKNGSLRVLVLNDLAAQVLASLPQGAPADTVLVGVVPQQLTVYTRRIFDKLGIHDASFHSLRTRPQAGSLCKPLIFTQWANCSATRRRA